MQLDTVVKVFLEQRVKEQIKCDDQASDRGWLLSTSDLAMLIGLEPASVVKHDELNRWGFIFTKCTERSGREVNWAIKRPE
ncbi:MAG: hypothetical protein KME25_28690 [Symplocastrum torsivum CPER-KK1]|jgi:hypothetical protein|uniref:Uncharacterized protein n=1 Tax=Symplocastrum torsivum CPER-KK1 TaxID=450513 RepID=A0A951UCF7_9CYAN|nr:hypothetical protein [Symplocastrum torsivum CPER-KK1]